MGRTWLILDCNYLCHRAFHVFSGLSHNGSPTGTLFGFFRDVLLLQDTHGTKDIIFCFDRGCHARFKDCPTYKQNREQAWDNLTDEQFQAKVEFRKHVKLLRTKYLRELGFRNIFSKKGYEADDVIASVCQQTISRRDVCLIVSSDHDLYQLLSDNVMMWNPTTKIAYTLKKFTEEFGIDPAQWPDVKAIAGCKTDNVIGIKGVGEKTAAKFISGRLMGGRLHEMIVKGNRVWKRNLSLVTLPYPGVGIFRLSEDCVTESKWRKLSERLGMSSISDSFLPPEMRRSRRAGR